MVQTQTEIERERRFIFINKIKDAEMLAIPVSFISNLAHLPIENTKFFYNKTESYHKPLNPQ